jgi:hypothetical protein
MFKLLITAENEVEADLIIARLSDAGIRSLRSPGSLRSGSGSGSGAGRDIRVEEEDLDRAREVLKTNEGSFDEDELARLSEEAGRQATEQAPPTPPLAAESNRDADSAAETTVPEHTLRRAFERLTTRERPTDIPDNPFGAGNP